MVIKPYALLFEMLYHILHKIPASALGKKLHNTQRHFFGNCNE